MNSVSIGFSSDNFDMYFYIEMMRVIKSFTSLDQELVNPIDLLAYWVVKTPSFVIEKIKNEFEKIYSFYLNVNEDSRFAVYMTRVENRRPVNFPIYVWSKDNQLLVAYDLNALLSILSTSEAIDYLMDADMKVEDEFKGARCDKIVGLENEAYKTLFKREIPQKPHTLTTISNELFHIKTSVQEPVNKTIKITNLESVWTNRKNNHMLTLLMKVTKIFAYGKQTQSYVYSIPTADEVVQLIKDGKTGECIGTVKEPDPLYVKVLGEKKKGRGLTGQSGGSETFKSTFFVKNKNY